MPEADFLPLPPLTEIEKKPNNIVWFIITVVVLGPAILLAWNIIAQPPGNQIFYNMNRPEPGAGFDIRSAEINEQKLELTVSYLGGCTDHRFDLYITDQKSDINRTLELHHSSDDTCSTKVTEDLSYDLAKVIDEHKSRQIIFTITGNGAETDPVIYTRPTEPDTL